MINVDRVYQKVLATANKEQRGYITPQEFNLMANQAQMELFEQYFFDVRQFNRVPGNSQEYSDPLNVLYERIGIFEVERGNTWMLANMPVVNDYLQIPEEIYKIGTVRVTNRQVELLNSKDYDAARISPLTSPTLERPIGYISNRGLKISIGDNLPNPVPGGANNLNISYIKKPSKVQWAYVVVNDKALYNDNVSVDFELHQSEETELVYKILKLAGINLKAQDVTEAGAGLEMAQVQQEKA